MTDTEFKAVAEDVFSDLLPKVKTADREEFLKALISELKYAGLDIEEDEEEEDEDQDEEDEGFEA